MSRYDTQALSQALGVSAEVLAQIPKAETYIMQGDVLPLDGPHRHVPPAHWTVIAPIAMPLMSQKPRVQHAGRRALCGVGEESFRCRRR